MHAVLYHQLPVAATKKVRVENTMFIEESLFNVASAARIPLHTSTRDPLKARWCIHRFRFLVLTLI